MVQVAAAALNPLDVRIQQGIMKDGFPVEFPYTLGTDLAGAIAAVGADVECWTVGDAVVGGTEPSRGGGLAEQAVVPAINLARLPPMLPVNEAAGVRIAAGTAWQCLFDVASLNAGQTVLIHAGAGGVGSFAVQMARNAGARVVATASGEGLEIARRLGADQVIDYKAEAFDEAVANVDVVLDTIGGDTQARSFGVLRRGGHLVSIVAPPDQETAKAHDVRAEFVVHQFDAKRFEHLLDLVSSGKLKVLVDRTVPLTDFADAFAHQASGRARGKIIIEVKKM